MSGILQGASVSDMVGVRSSISGLTGGTSTDLDGIATANLSTNQVLVEVSGIAYQYRLDAGTDAQSVPVVIRPTDYAASTNENVWRLVGAWKNGNPLHWNPTDDAFHEVAVSISGTSLATSIGAPIFVPEKSILASALAAWKFDEVDAAGTSNARDMLGTYHLTQNNTVPSLAGISGNARLLATANTEFFHISAGSHPFAFGDASMTVSAWVKGTTFAAGWGVAGVYNTSSNRCWLLAYEHTTGKWRFSVSHNGTTVAFVESAGSLSAGTWYHLVAYHDSANNLIGIGATAFGAGSRTAIVTAAHTVGLYAASNGAFAVGAIHGGAAPANAAIDEIAIWDRVLTSDEMDSLFSDPGF